MAVFISLFLASAHRASGQCTPCPNPANCSNDADFNFCVSGCTVDFNSCQTPGYHFWDFGDGTKTSNQGLYCTNLFPCPPPPGLPCPPAPSPNTTDPCASVFAYTPTHTYTIPVGQSSATFTVQHRFATSSNGPITMVTKQVTVTAQSLDASFNVVPTVTCSTYCVQVTATPNLACWLTHTWDFGDNTPLVSGDWFTAGTVNHCYTTAGNFNITHTLPCTPPTSYPVHPTFSGPSTLDAGFTYDPPGPSCGPVSVTFTANGNGSFPVSHFWKILDNINNNIIFTSTAPSFTFVFSTTGSYTVEHTVSEAGCGTTANFAPTLVIQTSVPIFGNGPGGAAISAASLPIGYTAIQINGILTISGSYIFPANSTVIMREGSEIRLNPGAKLNASGVTFKGCDRMWKGIRAVNNNASGFSAIQMGGCTIMDAEYGVWAEGRVGMFFVGCYFLKNHISLRIPSLAQGMGLVFNGNTLDGQGTFLPNYQVPSPQPIATGGTAKAGLYLENFVGSIGGGFAPSLINTFSNMKIGIYASKCIFTVMNSVFVNIKGTPLPNGSAIFAGDGSVLTQFGVSETSPGLATFKDCDHAVFVMSSSLAGCSLNRMENVGRGVYALFCSGKTINVFDNVMQCTKSGVRVYLSGVPESVRVADNQITIDATGIAGSTLSGVNFSESSYFNGSYRCFNNHITVNNGNNGILVSNLSARISNDTVILNRDAIPHGIDIRNAHNSGLTCNRVIGTGISSANVTNALFAKTSHSVYYSCNYFDHTRRGTRFEGPCDNSVFKRNSFNLHYDGLFLNSVAAIGPQPDPNSTDQHRGNVWNNNPYLGNGARFDNTNPLNISYSRFLVNTENGLYPKRLPLDNTPDDWFKLETGYTDALCSFLQGFDAQGEFLPDCDNDDLIAVEETMDIFDEAIAKGEYGADEASEWMADRHLHDRLLTQPNLIAAGSDFEDFMETEDNTSVGRFGTVQQGMNALFGLDSSTHAYRLALGHQVQQGLGELHIVAQQWIPGIAATDSLDLLSQQGAVLVSLTGYFHQLAALEGQIAANRSGEADLLLAENETVPTSRVFEENRKTVNYLYLRTVAKGIYYLTAHQTAQLEAIAAQCPEQGGEAVYGARVLLTLNGPDAEDGYSDDCQPAQPLILPPGGKRNPVVPMNIGLQPNPAKNKVRIVLPSDMEGEFSLRIFNALGQPVLAKTIDGGTDLDISSLPNGIYAVSLKGIEGNSTAKLVINR